MSKKITFTDLIEKIAQETGTSKKLIHNLLTEIANITKEGLSRDGQTTIKNLGTFQLKWHKSRKGRNPQTGEEIELPASNSIVFKPELKIREHINRKYAPLKPKPIEDNKKQKALILEEQPKAITSGKTERPRPVKEKKKTTPVWIWGAAILLIALIAIYYLLAPSSTEEPKEFTEAKPTAIEEHIKSNTIEEPVVKQKIVPKPNQIHKIQEGDKLWSISKLYYTNNGYLWPNIYRVNLNIIKNPDILPKGHNIQIPVLEGTPENPTQKDIENIAEGFIHAYLTYKNLGHEGAEYYLWALKEIDVEHIIEKYKDQIDPYDLEIMKKIKFIPKNKLRKE